MIYDVEWLDYAQLELDAIWLAANTAERDTLEQLLARINDRLAVAPNTEGEARPPTDFRLLFELPLRVEYRIERFRGAVVVVHVRLIRKRPQK